MHGRLKHPPGPNDVIPLTPIHVLLLDQYICSQAFGLHGFVGSKHSYVSEMIWNQRRAQGLEDVWAQEKQTLDGASQLTRVKTREEIPLQSGAAGSLDEHNQKDEL